MIRYKSRTINPGPGLAILALLLTATIEAKPLELTQERSGESFVYEIPEGVNAPYILEVTATRLPEPASLTCNDVTRMLTPDRYARITFRLESEPPCKLRLNGMDTAPEVRLWQPEEHFQASSIRSQFYGASFLVISVLALYLLSLTIALRNPIFLYLVLYTASFLLFEILHSGFHRELGLFNGIETHMEQFAGLLWPPCLLLFTMVFGRKKSSPRMDAAMVALSTLTLFLALQTIWFSFSVIFLNGVQLLFLGLSMAISSRRIRRVENLVLFLSLAVLSSGVVYSFFSLASSAPAGAVQLMLVSGLIAYRIHALQKREARAKGRSAKAWSLAVSSLNEAEKTRDRFLKDTAEQLQQPLKEIIASARAYAGSAPGSAKGIRQILEDASRLLEMVSDFSSQGSARSLPLAQLSEDALIHSQLFAASRNTRLLNSIPPDIFVHAHPADFRRLLARLIENYCILYTPAALSLQAERKKKRAILKAQATAPQKPTTTDSRKLSMARMVLDHVAKSNQKKGTQDLRFSFDENGFSINIQAIDLPAEFKGTEEAQEAKEGADSIVLYSEDILYGNRLREKLSDEFRCIENTGLDMSQSPAPIRALILDLLEAESSELASFLRRFESWYGKLPPVLTLSRSEDLSRIADPAGLSLSDRLAKPVSMDLIQLRLETLIAMDTRLREQKEQLVAIAEADQMKVRRSLHDSLGAQLTDLRLLADRLSSEDRDYADEMAELKQEIDRTITMVKDSLDEMGESQQFAQNLTEGLEETLVRRYTRAGRRVYRDFLDESIELPARVSDELFKVIQELITNDLKYGTGPAEWKLQRNNGNLQIEMQSGSHYHHTERSPGLGRENIQKRIQDLKGQISMGLGQEGFRAEIQIPLSGEASEASSAARQH